MAILVCAPLGSILVSTFGEILLEKPSHKLIKGTQQTVEDGKLEVDKNKQKNQDDIVVSANEIELVDMEKLPNPLQK